MVSSISPSPANSPTTSSLSSPRTHLSTSNSPTDSRCQALEQWNNVLRVQELDGAVDELRSMLDQEESHYTPCMDYLAAIAASQDLHHFTSSSSVCSSLSSDSRRTLSSSLQQQQQQHGHPSSNDSLCGRSVGMSVKMVNLTAADRDRVNEAWRRKLCEWCFEVVDHFGMQREVVSIAMNYLDRVVANTLQDFPPQDRYLAKREYQLVVVAALYIAVKLRGESEEINVDRERRPNIDIFVELSRGIFQADTIKAMERNILFNLGWHLNPPTPLKFIASMMSLMPYWSSSSKTVMSSKDKPSLPPQDEEKEVEDMPSFKVATKAIMDVAMYLTELSVMVSTFAFHSKSSVVAYASILCAMEALSDTVPLPYNVRVRFINHVAEATGLFPESPEVRAVRNLLMELCPAIQERDVSSLLVMEEVEDDADEFGSVSPVCVSRHVNGEAATSEELMGGRKRTRT